MPTKSPHLTHALHHFHPTLAWGIAAVVVVVFTLVVTRGRAPAPSEVVDHGAPWVFLTAIGVAAAAVYVVAKSKTPKAPAPKVVTHVITHVVTRPGQPVLSGGQLTGLLIVGAVLIAGYLIVRCMRRSA